MSRHSSPASEARRLVLPPGAHRIQVPSFGPWSGNFSYGHRTGLLNVVRPLHHAAGVEAGRSSPLYRCPAGMISREVGKGFPGPGSSRVHPAVHGQPAGHNWPGKFHIHPQYSAASGSGVRQLHVQNYLHCAILLHYTGFPPGLQMVCTGQKAQYSREKCGILNRSHHNCVVFL